VPVRAVAVEKRPGPRWLTFTTFRSIMSLPGDHTDSAIRKKAAASLLCRTWPQLQLAKHLGQILPKMPK
jgi:hypothetical protein